MPWPMIIRGRSLGFVCFLCCLGGVSSNCPINAQEGQDPDVLLLQTEVSMTNLGDTWRTHGPTAPGAASWLESHAKSSHGLSKAQAKMPAVWQIAGMIIAVIIGMIIAVVILALGIGMVARAATRDHTPQEVLPDKANEAEKEGKESQPGDESGPGATSQQANAAPASQPIVSTVVFFVVGHSLSASTLTVVNKWAMNEFHPPGVPAGDHHHGYVWLLSLIQFIFSAILAKLVGATGLSKCEPLTWKQGLNYFPAAGMFMISIVAGNAVMNYSSVSSFLVMRALVPIPCAILETVIYRDPLPPVLSWLALGVIVAGTLMYGTSLGGLEVDAIGWVVIFMVCMPVDGLLIKHAISASNLSSWGLVYYNNVLASLPLIFYVIIFEVPDAHAFSQMVSALMVPQAFLAVAVSCLVGVSISFFQMTTRYYVSATAFMVLGVVNKFLTVLWNEFFLEQDSSFGLMGILLTLAGAVAWQLTMSSVGTGSVKVRPKAESSQSMSMLAFGATVLGLAAGAYVQHITSK